RTRGRRRSYGSNPASPTGMATSIIRPRPLLAAISWPLSTSPARASSAIGSRNPLPISGGGSEAPSASERARAVRGAVKHNEARTAADHRDDNRWHLPVLPGVSVDGGPFPAG